MAKRKDIHFSRRGIAAGTAVAAALLVINGGIGYALLSGESVTENSMVANDDLAEQQEACTALPLYVDLMQQYYTATSGIPCNLDFSGYGTDLSIAEENENWRVTLKAVTGCDWVLYYFYDVEPLQGQTWEEFQQEFPGVDMHIQRAGEAQFDTGVTTGARSTMPGQSYELDNGCWHCYGIIRNISGVPFSQEGTDLVYDIMQEIPVDQSAESVDARGIISIADTLQYPATVSDRARAFYYNVEQIAPNGVEDYSTGKCGTVELYHTSITPFGLFAYGEFDLEDDSTGWAQSWYPKSQPDVNFYFADQVSFTQQDTVTLETVDSFGILDDSYCGSYRIGASGVACVNLLFDHPWDSAKGQITAEYLNENDNVVVSSEDARGNDAQVEIHSLNEDDGRDLIWENNDGDTTIALSYEIDMSKSDSAKYIEFHADLRTKEPDTPLRFRFALTAPDGHLVSDTSTLLDAAGVRLEPQAEPYTLTMNVQPLWATSDQINHAFGLRITFDAYADSDGTEPIYSYVHSRNVTNRIKQLDGVFNFGWGVYDSEDTTKPTLETLEYSESEAMLYLATQLTGHGTAEGESYDIYVKLSQGDEEIPFALTPEGEKQNGQWISGLKQGDLNETLTPLYMALDTAAAENNLNIEIWYVPDVIPPEQVYTAYTETVGGFVYTAHQRLRFLTDYTAE